MDNDIVIRETKQKQEDSNDQLISNKIVDRFEAT